MKKIFLPVHQMISSDIFEICKNFKMLSKRTFIFKLYSPKCVYKIIFLRPYSKLVESHSVQWYITIPQWHVFSTSNWIFLVIVLYECSKYIPQYRPAFTISSPLKDIPKERGFALLWIKQLDYISVIWIILTAQQSNRNRVVPLWLHSHSPQSRTQLKHLAEW